MLGGRLAKYFSQKWRDCAIVWHGWYRGYLGRLIWWWEWCLGWWTCCKETWSWGRRREVWGGR